MNAENTLNVLVTGVGAIIGYGVIKSLRQTNYKIHIVGMDIYEDAVGKYWCDEFIKAVYAVDPGYIEFLKKTIEKYNIDMVFFGTEQEIYRCADAQDELGVLYGKLVINKPEILALSRDKWKTFEALKDSKFGSYAIPSVIHGDYSEISDLWGKKFLLKPRQSYASKGIHRVDNVKDFLFYKDKMENNFMAQKIIGDNEHEYTVGCFGFGDGKYGSMIQLRRKLSQEGATSKAERVENYNIEKAVEELCMLWKPLGPTNFQFRTEEERVFLLEINPRISSSTSIRSSFGYNEAKMCLDYFLYKKFEVPQLKRGIATRYIDEVVKIDG